MMSLLHNLTNKAIAKFPRILLPESADPRIIQAAEIISRKKIAQVVLLSSKTNPPKGIEYINIDDEDLKMEYANSLYERRKHKELDLIEALELVSNPSIFAMVALLRGDVDGVVSGAITPSQEVLSNALRIIGVSEGSQLVSSLFLMVFDENHKSYGENIIFSDCAMNIDPSSEELVEIAKSAYKTAESFLEDQPKLAMLSFSTNQSAKHAQVDKVRLATEVLRDELPKADIIGNIQLDAALDKNVLKIKYPETSFIPPANVLVFPNLDAANIGYKLVQRFSGARAIGNYSHLQLSTMMRGCQRECPSQPAESRA